MEIEDAVHTAMLALKENFEGEGMINVVCNRVDEWKEYSSCLCIRRYTSYSTYFNTRRSKGLSWRNGINKLFS